MKLNDNFIYEIFKLAMRKHDVMSALTTHMKYEYLPSDATKKIFKAMKSHYDTTGKFVSYGVLAQKFDSDELSLEAVDRVKRAELTDQDTILKQLESYIKDRMSTKFYDDFAEVYNKGERDNARKSLISFANNLSNFSIFRDGGAFEKIFSGFEARQMRRMIDKESDSIENKVPFSIDELDEHTFGGIEVTETACALARSGAGKTKFLRYVGVGCARRGGRVLHIQAEGSKKQCEEGYDATWMAQSLSQLRFAGLSDEQLKEMSLIASAVKNKGGEIYVKAYEKFDRPSMKEVRQTIDDALKVYKKVDLVIMDYLELFNPSSSTKYAGDTFGEKARREAIAEQMKNIAVEFDTRVITATQASDIMPQDYNNPNWFMTRHNVSMAKNLPNSFSYFLTFNQTDDEYDACVMRIYEEKLRFQKAHKVIKIYQSYDTERFYDPHRTRREILGKV